MKMKTIDKGALKTIIGRYNIRSIRVIGDNISGIVNTMVGMGLDAYGIDTAERNPAHRCYYHNYSAPKPFKSPVDLIWFIGSDGPYSDNLYTSLNCARIVVALDLSKTKEILIKEFNKNRFYYSENASMQMSLDAFSNGRTVSNHCLVFVKSEKDVSTPDENTKWASSEFEKKKEQESIMQMADVVAELNTEPMNETAPISEPDVKEPIKIPIDKKGTLYHPITKEPLNDNQDLIDEEGKLYIVTINKSGKIRKGSKKLIE